MEEIPPDEVANSDQGWAAEQARYEAMGLLSDPEFTPEPTPDPELMTYEEETLQTLGEIEGLLIFFAVILLCFLVYKLFRMFF